MSRKRHWLLSAATMASCLVLTAAVAQASEPVVAPGETLAPVAAVQAASDAESAPAEGNSYGLNAWTVVNIPGSELHAYNTALGYIFWSTGGIGAQTGDTFRYFETTVHVPTGAIVYGATPFYYDNSAAGDIEMWLWQYTISNSGPAVQAEVYHHLSSGQPGYYGAYAPFASPVTWANWNGQLGLYYIFRVHLGTTDSSNRFEGLTLWTKRQVSPAPATASFNDVPVGAFGFQFIEALAASGITAGCGGGNFCPNDPITRAQMAIFLSAGLGLHWPDL
ncbi:MAG: S-layer homology domain-containing protein [Acidobacteriota bacterium]